MAIEAGTAAVNVKAINRQYITSGAASVSGGAVAVGGAGASIIFKSHTKAEVLNGTTITAGSLNVTAQSKETITGVVAAATGGKTAVGGSLILIIANADTTARIGNNVTINLSGDLTVQAEDIATIDMTAGTLSGGGTAVGGAAAVLIFKNTVLAEIGANGTIKAANLNLTANSTRNITSYVAAGSGGVGAVSGSVLVILVGSRQSDDAKTAMKRNDTNDVSSNSQKSIDEALINASSLTKENLKLDIIGYFTKETANATTAKIGSGTVITLTGDAKINAAETTTVTAYVGSASAGVVAAGGAVAIAILNGTVQVEINGTINAGGTVTINAENQITSKDFKAAAGSAGVIGLGAAVAYMDVTGTTQILIGNTGSISAAKGILAEANLIIRVNPTADGYGVGWVSAGMAASRLRVTGKTLVTANSGSSLTSATGDVKLTAYQTITSKTTTKAAGGGYVGSGTAALAFVDITGETKVNSAANVNAANGAYSLLAQQIINATAESQGLAVAFGGAIGVAVARLNIKPVIAASVSGGTINAKNLVVKALFNVKNDADYTETGKMESNAYAGAGGGVAGGSGANAEITVGGKATAEVSNANLTLTEDALVLSKANGSLTGNGAGLSVAGGAAVGGVVVKINNKFETIARITRTTITAARNVSVLADYSGTVKGTAKGTAGGLLVAGTAQSLDITEDITTTAEIANSNITANGAVSVVVQDEHQVTGKATGHSAAGFASGGLTKITTKITNTTTARATGSTITAKNILIQATTSINKDTKATASSGAFGGSANDVSDDTTVTNKTYAEVGSGSNLTATDAGQDGDAIVIIAASNNSYKGYATAIAGAIIAKGVAKATQNVTDDVRVKIYSSTILANKGNIKIYASAKDITSNLTAYGGAGGVAAGTNVRAEATTTVNAVVEFLNGTSNSHAVVKAESGNVFIGTSTNTEARVYGRIKFTVDGLSHISTDVVNKMIINSLINLGSYTELSAAKDLDIQAVINRIYAYASAYSETGSVINTQSKPSATVDVTANAKVIGTSVKLHAGQTLTLYAISTNDIYTNAYSYGYTAGGTGSVISTATNNTRVYGNVEIYGSDSSMNARDIAIGAAAKSESKVSYTKKAEYKAVTVTEFIKTTVTKTKNVIEKVSEKICKKLPWPLNKIVKWITKTIVKVISWVEEVIVEKVLQSETEKKENGQYKSENNVILNGDISYGNNADVNIVIDKNGDIANSDVISEKDGDNVIIKSFSSKTNGSLKIESLYGKVSGNVKIHSNNVITKLNITNNSARNLILKNIDLLAEYDADSCAYTILCSDYSKFVMEDVVDNTNQPVVTITTNTGKNVTFDGWFSYYTAILNVLFNGAKGSVYFGDNAKLDVAKLYIRNADNVGTDGKPLQVNLFVTEDKDGKLTQPELYVDAAGNVYIQAGLKRYIEVQGTTTADAKALADVAAAKINTADMAWIKSITGRNIRLILSKPKLVIGVLVDDPVNGNYTTTESVNTALNIVAETSRNTSRISETLYEKTEFNETIGEWQTKYYTDEECTNEYSVPAGMHVEVQYDENKQPYYLLVDDEITFIYKPLEGSEDAGKYDLIRYNKENQKYEAVKDGKVVSTFDYISYDETTGQYVGVTVKEIEKEANIEDMAPSKTTEFEYDRLGTYQIGKITASEDAEIRGLGDVDVNLTDTITAGDDLTLVAGSVTREGSQVVDLSAEGMTIQVTKNFGTSADPIRVSVGSKGFSTTANSTGAIYLAAKERDLGIGSITSDGLVEITADKAVKALGSDTNIKAAALRILKSSAVGTADQNLRTNISGNMEIISTGDIYVTQQGAAHVKNITSRKNNGTVSLTAGSIVNEADGTTAAINASNILLHATTGSIGSVDKVMNVEAGNGMLSAVSDKGNIYLTDLTGDVNLGQLKAAGNIVFKAAGNIIGKSTATNTATVIAADANLTSTNGNIGAVNNLLKTQVTSITATAENGSIYLDNTAQSGTLSIGSVKAKSDVQIEANSMTGTADGDQADVIGGNLKLTAVNGSIGTADRALKVKADTLDADAAKNIWMKSIGSTTVNHLTAPESIQFTATDKMTAGAIAANEVHVTTKKLDITAKQIAEGTNYLKVKGYGSDAELELQAKAQTGVYIQDSSKTLKLKNVSSDSNDVKIKTTGAMVNGLGDTDTAANVTAKNIVLEADTVGTDEKALTTNLIVDNNLPSATNALIVKANGNINLHDIGTEGVLPITEMSSANGDISFRAERSTAIETIKAENGSITSRVNGDYSMNNLKAGKMVNIYATGKITGNVDGNLTIGHVEAGSADDRKDITLTINNGNLLSGLESTEADQTNLRGQNITLTAKAGAAEGSGNLGTAEKRITAEADGKLSVTASKSIYLHAPKNTVMSELNAEYADLLFDGKADITSSTSVNGKIDAKGLNLTAEGSVGNAQNATEINVHGEKLNISAKNDIYVNEVDAESGKTDIGMVASENGNVTLTTAQDTVINSLKAANGNVTTTTAGSLEITDLTAESINAKAATTITAGITGDIIVKRLEAPESINVHATGTLYADHLDDEDSVHVTTKKLDITAGQIAADEQPLKVKGTANENGVTELELNASTENGAFIQDNSNILKLKHVEAENGAVKIKTTGSMVNGLDKADEEENKKANVKAQTIVLESGSSIGAAKRNVTTNLVFNPLMEADNTLTVKADGNMYLHDIGTTDTLQVADLTSANGNIIFTADRATVAKNLSTENGTMNYQIHGDFTAEKLKAEGRTDITADGNVDITSDGDLILGRVEAGEEENRKNITIKAEGGNLLNGLEAEETSQTNLTGKDITLNATDGTGNLGTAGKWLVLETEGQLKADAAGNMWLEDVRTQKPEEGTWNVGHLVSGSEDGEIHLKSARDTAIYELTAGMINLDIDGMAYVMSSGSLNGTIKSKGLNLKADSIGAKADESEEGSKDQYLDIDADGKQITISAEHDIYANEINQESGLTVIDSLFSANGNISLKTAQDTEIGSMKAEHGAGMAETAGNLTIAELTAKTADMTAAGTLEIAEIIADSLKAVAGELLKVATSKDLHAELLHADRVEAEAAGEMVIDELLTDYAKLTAGKNADVTTSGDLSAGTIEAANIRLKAAGDLGTREEALMLKTGDRVEAEAGGLINIQETSTEPGKTTITAKSDKDDVTVETNRDLVLEDTQGQNVNVTTGGKLEAKNIEAAENGRLYMEAEKDIVINNDAQSVFGRLVSRTGGIDLTQAGNIVVESLAAAGIVNMKTDDFIKVIAESILYLGTWTADQLIEITSQYDILNGLNVATACNATVETVRMNTSGNIGSAEKSVRTKAENGGFKAENLYLDNDGSLKLENTEIGKDADLTVNGDLTNEDAVLKAEKLHVKAEHADLTTDVDEIAGEVAESIAIRNQKGMKVTEQLTAGKEVSIETPGGTIEVSGIIASPKTILKGADHIIVRVTDKIGELDVETAEKKDTGEEDTDETLDQPSVDLTMESSKDNQQIHVTTPGSFKMTTTEADEIIRFFGDRIRLQGGTNDAEIWFNLAPGTVEAIVPGGNNLIDIVTTMAPTTITTGNGDDTFILGGPVEDEKDAAYKFHENGITGEEEGYLGAGNQHELRISTESGTNTWHLWMSGTDFYLEGGMGDDTYIRHGFTYEDRDGNIGYFATNHYHITDAGGYNTYIGFPVAREEKDRKHDPEAGLKGRWIQTADGNWMFKMDDGFAKSMWVKVGQKWWYMNEDGYMHTGWLLYNNQWYYLIPGEGSMHMGWILINGIWYYLNPVYQEGRPQGSMYCNEYTPDGYFVGADGAWIPSIPRYLGQKTA